MKHAFESYELASPTSTVVMLIPAGGLFAMLFGAVVNALAIGITPAGWHGLVLWATGAALMAVGLVLAHQIEWTLAASVVILSSVLFVCLTWALAG